ncbi:MAG: MBL fold metallo-hydrolase [Opitutales bacterium]
MRLTDLNCERGIGANSMLVEIGPFRLLIDAGMHPKRLGLEALPQYDALPDDSIDFILVTHAHLDHIGSLPVACRRHPNARILVSTPSRVLVPRMLRNSCNVMSRQREEHRISAYPLYTFGEIARLEGSLLPMLYGQPRTFFEKEDEIEITYFAAGHVAGAAGIELVYKHRSIFFTGDVLFRDQRILEGARFPQKHFDTLVLETTRGRTETAAQADRLDERERLLETIIRTLSQGGSVLIPAFALGRMQEIFSILNDARKQGRLPKVPVYGSGLGLDLVDHLDQIARKTGLVDFRKSVLRELGVRPLKAELRPGRDVGEQAIYVLSSGMVVDHTPSYAAAAAMINHAHNTICFVGYCDPETVGGKILHAHHDDVIVFEKIKHSGPLRAQVERFDLSGHADREELLDFALKTNARACVLTHGDPESRTWFDEELATAAPEMQVIDPEVGTPYQV